MTSLATFDFTLKVEGYEDIDIVFKFCKDYFKHWAFQKERSSDGYVHWQGRGSLIKKRTFGAFKVIAHDAIHDIHITITSKETHLAGNKFNYVMKADTRIEGPWTSEDKEMAYIPRQVREITELRPWQTSVIRISKVWDTRKIHCIVDENGNTGKSTLVSYMRCHDLGRKIPFANDYKDIMRCVMDMPTSNCYLIDIPRAISKDRLFQMWGAIEEIKSGYAYDDRYSFKEKMFDCPQIFVFLNKKPDVEFLSNDRWVFHTIKMDLLCDFEEGFTGATL